MFLPRLGHVTSTYTYKSIQKPLDGKILFLKTQHMKPGLPIGLPRAQPNAIFL